MPEALDVLIAPTNTPKPCQVPALEGHLIIRNADQWNILAGLRKVPQGRSGDFKPGFSIGCQGASLMEVFAETGHSDSQETAHAPALSGDTVCCNSPELVLIYMFLLLLESPFAIYSPLWWEIVFAEPSANLPLPSAFPHGPSRSSGSAGPSQTEPPEDQVRKASRLNQYASAR